MKHRNLFAVYLLFCFIFLNSQPVSARQNFPIGQLITVESFWRTELYFGTGKPDGSEVSVEEWSKFLAAEVTPRFPEGFTVLDGFGQFRDSNGKIVRETSHCLILLYPKRIRKENNLKIEEIREIYKKTFQQESVLRLDFKQSVSISF
jgi:Protein of unknown function (DUF3574)